jgi:hypothetical protein
LKDQVSVKIINLAHRLDRKEECRKEMAALGWDESHGARNRLEPVSLRHAVEAA